MGPAQPVLPNTYPDYNFLLPFQIRYPMTKLDQNYFLDDNLKYHPQHLSATNPFLGNTIPAAFLLL